MSWEVAPGSEVAMRTTRRGLEEWLGNHRSAAADAVLVAAELLANAVVTARSCVVVSAAVQDGHVVLEVSDDGHGDDYLDRRGQRRPAADSEQGRGLFLVRALSEDVSMTSTAAGTVVRCVIPAR